MAVCTAVLPSAVLGDADLADWPGNHVDCAARTSICRGGRREELETQADCCAVGSAYRRNAGNVYPSRPTCALEPSDGRLEQPADSFTVFDGTHCTRTKRGSCISGETMPQLSLTR